MGIVWLIPIFGAYFGAKLVRSGHRPESAGRVVVFSLAALLAAVALSTLVVALTGAPNTSLGLGAVWVQQIGIAVASLVSVLLLRNVWPAFFRTMLAYAFASRIPVLIVMLVAMLANWGTHYELPPPGYPEMGFLAKFVPSPSFPS